MGAMAHAYLVHMHTYIYIYMHTYIYILENLGIVAPAYNPRARESETGRSLGFTG